MAEYSLLEQTIGYEFSDKDLLQRALTHASFLAEQTEDVSSYERLEFLGDAVLGLVLAQALFEKYPEEQEGFLAKARSTLAKGSTLVKLAKKIGLGTYLRLGASEEESGGRKRSSTLEDAFEALIGAIYLDGGFGEAERFILQTYGDISEAAEKTLQRDNPKGKLQEWAQARDPNAPPIYTLIEESGPPHQRTFTSKVELPGDLTGTGTGRSKKEAEENAAREVLAGLE